MKRLVLTDALIREALTPDPHVTAPAGLLAQITADVARTPQHRTLRLPALPRSRRLAWVLVGAATLLALLGALLVGGGSRNPLEAFLPPAPSPQLQRLPVVMAMGAEIESVSADEAWASDGTERLWHRTAAGWAGPILPDPTAIAGTAYIRDLARMPDGRLVVGADSGLWVGSEAGWTRLATTPAFGVATDSAGAIWAASTEGGHQHLDAFREVDGSWRTEMYPCGAGGDLAAVAADGTAWTAGIGYVGGAGIARLSEGACGELLPWGDGATHDVLGITADGTGRVAVAIMDIQEGDQYPGGRIMAWDGQRWATLREGVEVRVTGWNGLSYGPDGDLWAAFDGQLRQYANGVETSVRGDVGNGPVSVAPDGTVWFVAQDPETGAAFVDRLLPGGDTAEPTPAPSPAASAQAELAADYGWATRLLAIDGERAWVARTGASGHDQLWHRDAAGWTGPISVGTTAINANETVIARGIADLGDGRMAIATDTGLWVGVKGAWTRIWAGQASDIAWAPDGRLWVAGVPEEGSSTLRVLRETGEGWRQDWSGCRSGGNAVAIAADGSVWTSGITYSSMGGVARALDGACEEMQPLGEGRGEEVMSIAASPSGAVAVHVLDPLVDDHATGGRVLEWQDGRWTELRAGSDLVGMWHSLAYTPDGALWAAFDGAVDRYADGQWQEITTAMPQAPISAAADGTVWYVRADGVIDRMRPVDSLETSNP